MDFKAAMFDFDGTITDKGVYYPNPEMSEALIRLAQVMPIAFCTGRQLDSFERHGLVELLKNVPEAERTDFLKNLFVLAENGAIGYHFDLPSNDFKEFYSSKWPQDFIDREFLREKLGEIISGVGVPYPADNAHKVVIVLRTILHDQADTRVDDVYAHSDEIARRTIEFLRGYDAGFEKKLHVGNSGIGVIVGPAEGDKNRGIYEFGRYLNEFRAMGLGENFRDIMVVGDRPEEGGNDHYFLDGEYGIPFTVGNDGAGASPVIDTDGNRLLNSQGTMYLVKKMLEKVKTDRN